MAISSEDLVAGKKAPKKAATITEDEKMKVANEAAPVDENLGSAQGDIEFLYSLGNENDKDTTVRGEDKHVVPRIIGYMVKNVSDHDIIAPDCGLGADARSNKMSYNKKDGTRVIKPGEEFPLTLFETGLLISRPEYNCAWTGGDPSKHVTAIYVKSGSKSRIGDLLVSTASSALPTVALKLNSGSIKDGRIEPIITRVEVKAEDGTVRRRLKVKEGFEERFGALAKTVSRSARVGGAGSVTVRDSKTVRNSKGEAFLNLVNALPNRNEAK